MSPSSDDSHSAPRRRIGIVCLSAIPDDPRVRRQGDLLTKAGWEVVAIGLPGARSSAPDWTCLDIDERPDRELIDMSGHNYVGRTDHVRQVATLYREKKAVLAAVFKACFTLAVTDPAAAYWLSKRVLRVGINHIHISALSRPRLLRPVVWAFRQMRRARRVGEILRLSVDKKYAHTVYWGLNDRFARIYNHARSHRVDLWLANDWTTLPIARRLASEQGVPYGYDTHELAVDEYAQSLFWRVTQRPVIAAVETVGIRGAAFTTCVSDGIADRLADVYSLPARPVVIRNMPMYSAQTFRPTGESIEVLYHGVVSPGRGLEDCIRSVALWRPEFRLTIRGPSSPAYLARLRAECEAAGVNDRVMFDEPVPMTELVARAASFDVGLFALPDHSLQNVYVLPNKFFEYTMAGLALCVSDLPEMTRLVKRHDLGELIAAVTPVAIAEAINRLDRAAVDRFKQNALISAKELCWEVEGEKFVRLSEDALSVHSIKEANIVG